VLKKVIFGAAALVAVGIFVGPVAANAVYAPHPGSVSGPETPGSADTVSFPDGSFQPGEPVVFQVSGVGAVTIAMLRADTAQATETATSGGAASATVTLPSDATGTYEITATGTTSGTTDAVAFSVVPASGTSGSGGSTSTGGGSSSSSSSSDSGLADTGSNVSMLLIWSATGAVGLGAALVVVLLVVRRQRATGKA
jgi:hypothetical protein